MIEPGQTYRALGDPYPYTEPRRIKVVGRVVPGAMGHGKAHVVTLTSDGRELRRRAIEIAQLHDSATTADGQPRRTGYALEQP